MAVRIPDALSRIVKSMSNFILRLHYSNKGKSKSDLLTDVGSLPEPMESFIMNFFNKYKDEFDERSCQCIASSPNCVKTLMDCFNISFHEPIEGINEPGDFITWCCKLCLQAAYLYEHQFVEAPDMVIQFILDMCKKNNKYASFVHLVCKL